METRHRLYKMKSSTLPLYTLRKKGELVEAESVSYTATLHSKLYTLWSKLHRSLAGHSDQSQNVKNPVENISQNFQIFTISDFKTFSKHDQRTSYS